MKKHLLVVISLVTLSVTGYSQYDYQFNHFFFDRVSLNPAAAGMEDNCLGVFFREQWSGFSGNPSTFLINYNQPVKLVNGGLGVTFYNDRIGNQKNPNTLAGVDGPAITTNAIRLSYSYHIPAGPGRLGLGLSVGYLGAKVGGDWYAIDGTINDDAIPSNEDSQGGADFSFGAFYQAPNFWAGLSSTHLSAQDLNADDFDLSVARHYYFMTGYKANIPSADIDLYPSLLVKSDFVSNSIDFNIRAEYQSLIWAGVSVRSGIDAISPMAGLNYALPVASGFSSSVRLGYSYDVTISDINNFSSGSHEIYLGYCWKFVRPIIRKPHGNPRFL